jgi:hypothetical protein
MSRYDYLNSIRYIEDPERVISKEIIECPNCGSHQEAEVTQLNDFPFALYVHGCTNCKYIITESEWKTIRKLPLTGATESDTSAE